MSPLVLLLDDASRVQLLRALVNHARLCQRQGGALAAPLAALAHGLAAGSGQERPELAAASVEPAAYGYAEAAARLGVSPRSVRRMVAEGRLPRTEVGRRVLIPAVAVEELANGRGADGRGGADR